MLKQSFQLAKRKANADGRLSFTLTYDKESEDLNYNIEWMKIVIQGTKEQEEEEYEEAMQMYKPYKNVFKKEIPKDDNFAKQLKTKLIPINDVNKCYEEGYGAMEDKSLAKKFLEMGIMTNIEWIKDFDSRKEENIKFDM